MRLGCLVGQNYCHDDVGQGSMPDHTQPVGGRSNTPVLRQDGSQCVPVCSAHQNCRSNSHRNDHPEDTLMKEAGCTSLSHIPLEKDTWHLGSNFVTLFYLVG